jgi:hypothetical protein
MRFDALAGYCRVPQASLVSQELEWFEYAGGALVCTLIEDLIDGDFSGIILARDELERFRWVGGTTFSVTPDAGREALNAEATRIASDIEMERRQGDSTGKPVDFFAPVTSRDRMNPGFLKLLEQEGFTPARAIIEPMMRWYEDLDGNFIEQFQTTGFDARIWELYLFATFIEAGYAVPKKEAVPDFTCFGLDGELCIEATTVNPTVGGGKMENAPPTGTPQEIAQFNRHYMPIKYAGPLTKKLAKKYWDKEHVKGKPLLFAIQDFHAPMSLLLSRSALPTYLYGMEYESSRDEGGRLVITPRPVTEHRWGNKTVPFALKGAEHVSAVIFSNSGTISKFNRMGVLSGFGSPRVRLTRRGLAVDHDPNAAKPKTFERSVNDPNYRETWIEGLDVFHNPRALVPIEPEALVGAAHHRLLANGQMESLVPESHTFSSVTLTAVDPKA